ncbi:DNA topoisomerase IV subunit A [Geminicoccaceae bacterium 1502E]|nr:DNA topoisomerase IV subunit A [Geminicoccaceae bacterium 1502E]
MSQAAARPENIRPVSFNEALSERYLAYALSTITSRSLPDVRDGLKPVQRRLLYAMLQLRLDPASGYKKCARVVGDVIGKFHPHGDVAVYDALVRLAQEFAQRYPLVDGQGNFGNVDGDSAAAMRYTESRLTEVAMALLQGIDEDSVDFRPTYDDSENEPVVLPAAFPNLLANGSAGIAVGMATSIPPHNAGELLRAVAWMLEHPAEAPLPPVDRLLEHVRGPDLPTGGILVETPAVLAEMYRTGRGSLRLRARWEVEQLAYGQYQLVVTEIPYQVQKSRLVERLAELLAAKKVPLLGDLRDESAETVRIVLQPRSRGVQPELLMEQLFRASDLEVRLAVNMNVLDGTGTPRVMSLAEMLQAFIDHRMEVLVRRTNFRLGKIADRLELLEGYLKAFLDIDRVIRIIRDSDEPKPELIAAFELTERQAEAILNLRLRNLRKLEEMALRKEHDALLAEQGELQGLLASEPKRRKTLRAEMLEGVRRFGGGPLGRRRTELGEAPSVDVELLEAPVERFPVTVVLSEKGWIRAQRGHIEKPGEIKYKDGDAERFVLRAQSSDKLLLLTSDGRCFQLAADKLPSGRGHGEPLALLVDLPKGAEVLALRVYRPDGRLVVGTAQGRGFVAVEKDIAAQTRAGRQVVNVAEGDRLVALAPVEGDLVATVGNNHKILIFRLDELPEMARGRGVILQRFKDAELTDLVTLTEQSGLVWQANGQQRQYRELGGYMGKRGGTGRLAPRGFPKTDRFS